MTRAAPPIGIALAALAASALAPAGLRADSIWIRSGDSVPAETKNVTVVGIENHQLLYKAAGEDRDRPIESVWKLKVDNQPALSEAEELFAAGDKMAVAAAAYEKAFNAAPKDKPWAKDRAAARMVLAARAVGTFRLQATAYAMLASRDPAAAAPFKPAIPADAKGDLPALLAAVGALPANDTVKAFRAQLFIAAGDLAAAGQVVAGARSPDLLVVQAMIQQKQGNFPGALQTINQNRAAFVTPDSQFEALYVMAECQAATAGTDPGRQQDAAVGYLRVVAHFPGRRNPIAEDCLKKAAALLEAAGQKAEALALYQQVIEEYPKSPTTRPVADKVAELSKHLKPANK